MFIPDYIEREKIEERRETFMVLVGIVLRVLIEYQRMTQWKYRRKEKSFD